MSEISIEEVAPVYVAFVETKGPYEEWGRALLKLIDLLKRDGHEPKPPFIGRFYDSPEAKAPSELRSEACVAISRDVNAGDGFAVKELAGGKVAVTEDVDPQEPFTKTYGPFLESLLTSGYHFRGPAREIFPEAREDLTPGMGTRILQPVSEE